MKLSVPHRREHSRTARRRVTRPAERKPTAHTLFSDAELAAVNQAPVVLRALRALPSVTMIQLRRLWKWAKPRTVATIRVVRRLPLRYQILVVGAFIIGVIVIIAWTVFFIRHQLQTSETQSSTKTGTPSSVTKNGPKKATPTFSTLTPGGSKIDTYYSNSPSGREPAYVYVDKIGQIVIRVSQQLLPEPFNKDPDGAVKDLATDFAATDVLKVGDTTVYSGVSSDGPQSIIFTKNERLVLITADSEIDSKALSDYIKSLR